MKRGARFYGLMAEFDDPQHLLEAVKAARQEGYRKMEAYTPFSVDEVSEALGHGRGWIPAIVLFGGIFGGAGGFFMQWYSMAILYPFNIGGRPLWSWPAFIPITFECTVLVAAFSAVLGMLFLNKLPQPYHPVFNAPNFAMATRDRFFLVVEANDPQYNHDAVVRLLQSLNATEVIDVEV